MRLEDPTSAAREYRPYIVEELVIDEAEFADEPVVMPELTFEPQTFGRRPGRRPLRDEAPQPTEETLPGPLPEDEPTAVEVVVPETAPFAETDAAASNETNNLRSESSTTQTSASPKPKRRRGRRGRRKGGSDS
jgi:hypothetical protein